MTGHYQRPQQNNLYMHTHLRKSSWEGTLTHTTCNGEVQIQTKRVSYLLHSHLFIRSIGNDPTFITRNRREVLDITLTSDPILNQLEAWKVGIEHSFSDHRYIEFTTTLDCAPAENITNLVGPF